MSRSPGIVEFVGDIHDVLTDDEVTAHIAALKIENTKLRARNAQLRAQAEQRQQKEVDRMVQDILKSRQRQ